jgi:DNA polymerase-1
MRCAFGGDVAPEPAVRTATNMIERAARELAATHLVVALDCPGTPSWRKQLYPEYKANRATDTRPWIEEAAVAWLRRKWWVEAIDGYEADDIIATVAMRAGQRPGAKVTVISGDSDLLPLTADGVTIVKPINGGRFEAVTREAICARYGITSPAALVDLKAMTGETGDNVPGVPGIGPVRAAQLLAAHTNLEGVITAGQRDVGSDGKADKYAAKVAAGAEVARLSLKLVSLVRDVPVVPITPRDCAVDTN